MAIAKAVRTSTPRIAVLDGYRTLAIFCVLTFHYMVKWPVHLQAGEHFPYEGSFDGITPLHYGWAGVEFFFVISGFVILMTLERCRNVGDFAIRRFARLWSPLFVAATLSTIIIYLIGPKDWLVSRFDYVASILLIDPSDLAKLLHIAAGKWVDGAYWSLWVEVRFYALIAVAYLLARRNIVGVWLVFQGFVFVASLLVHGGMTRALLGLAAFPMFLPYFTLGICIYEIYSDGAHRGLAIVGAVTTACIILFNARFAFIYPDGGPIGFIIVNVLIFVLLFLFTINHPVVNVFASRPMVTLGQASYSLYLIHQNIGVAIMRACIGLGVSYFVVLPLTVGLMLAMALLLFRYVEVPAKSFVLRHTRTSIALLEHHLPWLNYPARVEN